MNINTENKSANADLKNYLPEDHAKLRKLIENIEKVFKGKQKAIELSIIALLSRGHILLEDVPGVGKTTLACAIASSIGCEFKRIQFTSDLLPSDIIGVSIYDPKKGEFEFKPGPIFANVILADEINRTTPRTQSALLEAMNEFQVTVDNTTHKLNQPFIVIATQNPKEHHGTYPLPESQMDRFFLRVSIGYPERNIEEEILNHHGFHLIVDNVEPVITLEDVQNIQNRIPCVFMDQKIKNYLMDIVTATRNVHSLDIGVSTRGAISLFTAAKSMSYLKGRDYCLPDDVKELIVPVFCHRVATRLRLSSTMESRDEAIAILTDIMDKIPPP